MKPNLFPINFLTGLIFCCQSVFALGSATNLPPRLTVELCDGSRVVGQSVAGQFKFHSALLGDLKLAVKDIRAVECVSSNLAKLSTANADSLTVSFVDSQFAVQTSFGRVDLPVNSVRKFSVSVGGTGAHPPGLVALWSGEGDGRDSVGGNDALLTDIAFAEGKVGQAFSFNGTSSSIRIPASQSLDIGAGDGFTIMAWIKPSDVEGIHPMLTFMGSMPLVLQMGLRPSDNGVLSSALTDVSGSRYVVSHPEVLAADIFQHVATTYDKSSGIGTLYLNGVVVAQRRLGSQPVTSTKGELWISHRDTSQGNWSSNRAFAGLMDEIAIYSRTLSASEIQAICTEENRGDPLSLPSPSTGWFENWMR